MILIQCKLRLVLVYILKQGIDDKKNNMCICIKGHSSCIFELELSIASKCFIHSNNTIGIILF